MTTAVILVNYNGSNDTIACINSLNQCLNAGDIKTIVVDNSKSEKEKKKLEEFQASINDSFDLIFLNENRGFSHANNAGIKYALEKYHIDFLMLLNNDTLVEPDFLVKLITQFDASSLMVTPKVLFNSKRELVWSAGGHIDFKKGIGANNGFMKDSSLYSEVSYCDYSPFCSVMFKPDLIKKYGYLDENYFMYFEDVDYCMRLLENGKSIKYVPDSVVYHKVSASSGGLRSNFYLEWMTRNQKKFIKKFFGKNKMVYLRFLLKVLAKKTFYFLKFNFAAIKCINKGLRH